VCIALAAQTSIPATTSNFVHWTQRESEKRAGDCPTQGVLGVRRQSRHLHMRPERAPPRPLPNPADPVHPTKLRLSRTKRDNQFRSPQPTNLPLPTRETLPADTSRTPSCQAQVTYVGKLGGPTTGPHQSLPTKPSHGRDDTKQQQPNEGPYPQLRKFQACFPGIVIMFPACDCCGGAAD
jgi:hypothetical protein